MRFSFRILRYCFKLIRLAVNVERMALTISVGPRKWADPVRRFGGKNRTRGSAIRVSILPISLPVFHYTSDVLLLFFSARSIFGVFFCFFFGMGLLPLRPSDRFFINSIILLIFHFNVIKLEYLFLLTRLLDNKFMANTD